MTAFTIGKLAIGPIAPFVTPMRPPAIKASLAAKDIFIDEFEADKLEKTA